jgi:nucleoside-diphosphate-sugar epimerase
LALFYGNLAKMTSPPVKDKIILVTGINGYIGSHIGLQLLQKGYSVRGTVRSLSKAQRLLEGAYRDYLSRLEVIVIPDITSEGAFDEAVRGECFAFRKLG